MSTRVKGKDSARRSGKLTLEAGEPNAKMQPEIGKADTGWQRCTNPMHDRELDATCGSRKRPYEAGELGAMESEQFRGILLEHVDAHSLRLGGACALKLSGHDNVEVMKMGCWASN